MTEPNGTFSSEFGSVIWVIIGSLEGRMGDTIVLTNGPLGKKNAAVSLLVIPRTSSALHSEPLTSATGSRVSYP